MKQGIFLQWNTKFSHLKVVGLLSFGPFPNCMSYVTIFAESEFKVFDEIVLNTGGPFTCEYVTLFQSIHRGTLSIHWYITFLCPSDLDALLRLPWLAGS